MLFIPFKIYTLKDSRKLLATWYYSPAFQGHRILWLPNKDRFEYFVGDRDLKILCTTNISNKYLWVHPDLYTLLTFNLRYLINEIPILKL